MSSNEDGPGKSLEPPPLASSLQKPEENNVSVKPGNHDRGWNDPPVFAVETNIGGRPVPTKLNKRVAFPLSSGIGLCESGGGNVISSSSPPPPPVPTNFGSIPPNYNNPANLIKPPTLVVAEGKATNANGAQEFTLTKESVLTILTTASENVSLEPKAKEDVKKRLNILESSWDTFSEDVKFKISQLSRCLEQGNYKMAEQIQMSLGSEYISQCSPWIMAVKNIIIRAKQDKPGE